MWTKYRANTLVDAEDAYRPTNTSRKTSKNKTTIMLSAQYAIIITT